MCVCQSKVNGYAKDLKDIFIPSINLIEEFLCEPYVVPQDARVWVIYINHIEIAFDAVFVVRVITLQSYSDWSVALNVAYLWYFNVWARILATELTIKLVVGFRGLNE